MNLREIQLFKELSDSQIEKINEVAQAVEFSAEETIFNIGDDSNSFYILKEGSVQIEMPLEEGQNIVSILHPVTIFGEVGLLKRNARSATVIAQDDCFALRIENEKFLNLLEDDVDMAAKFYRSLSEILFQRLSQTTERLSFFKLALSLNA